MVSYLIFFGIVGCSMLFLTSCGGQDQSTDTQPEAPGNDKQNESAQEIDTDAVTETLDGELNSGEPVVRGAEVLCTNGKDDKDILLLLGEDDESVEMVDKRAMTKRDIRLSNDNKFQFCKYLQAECPGAEVEFDSWQFCEPFNSYGEEKNALNKDESFMLCLKGLGIIYLLESGQSMGELEDIKLARLMDIFENWWNGEFMLRERIEPIVNYLCQKSMLDTYKTYIISPKTYMDMGFHPSQANDFSMIDMNRVLNKYDITTTERLRHFFAQCYVETGNIAGLPIEQDYGNPNYLPSRYYYPYIGAGHIQLTHEYAYQAFATYMAIKKYPDLGDTIIYLTPARYGPKEILDQYDKLKEEAKNIGVDISEIIKIVEPPKDAAKYVAENFEWESAGYFWESGEANKVVDSLTPDDKNEVDKITNIVNLYTPTRKERREAYEKNIKGFIK